MEGSIDQSIKELRNHIIKFNSARRVIKVAGLSTFFPNIDLNSQFAIVCRANPALNYVLNMSVTFSGTIFNREIIGKSCEELVIRWNRANPEDPVGLGE